MERVTRSSIGIRAGRGVVVPRCPNSGVGEGNCLGMVKHETCPAVSLGSERGKFPECQDFITKQKKISQCSSGN